MSDKKVKKYEDNDFYYVSFKNPPFLHREHLIDLTKEELIKLYTETSKREGNYISRINFLERLINYVGQEGELKKKKKKDIFFKYEFVRIYLRIYEKLKNHPKTASKIEEDKDIKLLKRFGSLTKRWIGDDIKKKEEEGEILSYRGHSERFDRYLAVIKKLRYQDPPTNESELKDFKENQKM